ncbi:MAG: D-alanine--D-alanine ligase [Patescibacteria group bacterium]|nr:D-alanine--D-alanine ligase [Patescibacteria group bacterium]MDE2172702.1 D-alanine--D-alanine ligase [Patescibacteria group bacterium]
MKHLIRVGVLRGGPSNEYEISLNSGASVLDVLRSSFFDTYEPVDIFIDRNGVWHIGGVAVAPETAIHRFDVAFNALHGAYGEDGKIQHFLEAHQLPFTGTGSLGSAIGMNKVMSKKIFKSHGIPTPYGGEVSSESIRRDVNSLVSELYHSFLMPAVIKPAASGSSVGVTVVKYYDGLAAALVEAARHSDSVIIEEFIPGIEATCGVIEGFRGQEVYALPPIEIRPASHFFDYQAKYSGASHEIVPATFSNALKRQIEELSAKMHRVLGLRHYSRSDFIIHPRRGIYALEANTLPGLTGESLMPKALRAVGSDMPEFIDHLIGLAVAAK